MKSLLLILVLCGFGDFAFDTPIHPIRQSSVGLDYYGYYHLIKFTESDDKLTFRYVSDHRSEYGNKALRKFYSDRMEDGGIKITEPDMFYESMKFTGNEFAPINIGGLTGYIDEDGSFYYKGKMWRGMQGVKMAAFTLVWQEINDIIEKNIKNEFHANDKNIKEN